jgi:hypothetical protein
MTAFQDASPASTLGETVFGLQNPNETHAHDDLSAARHISISCRWTRPCWNCIGACYSAIELLQAGSHGIVDDYFHNRPHICDPVFFVEEDLHNLLHVVFGFTPCILLLPVNIEERSLHVDGEGEVHCIDRGLRDARAGVELAEIAVDGSAITRTWEQWSEDMGRMAVLDSMDWMTPGHLWHFSTERSRRENGAPMRLRRETSCAPGPLERPSGLCCPWRADSHTYGLVEPPQEFPRPWPRLHSMAESICGDGAEP